MKLKLNKRVFFWVSVLLLGIKIVIRTVYYGIKTKLLQWVEEQMRNTKIEISHVDYRL